MWGLIGLGLAAASFIVEPKAKKEAMQKAIDKALAERDAAKEAKEQSSNEEED